ncbi:MAG: ABC transporter permease [Theionarchaea archaeon]|nr:ABC transporter permease [Theionarchaea archaeon]MBU7021395.1 ABC transporter permease [Theionarchaea archaeon]MBU7041025.1 ABC transporter permease [Theionarchaea archaeon]
MQKREILDFFTKNRSMSVGISILLIYLIAAIFAPLLSPHDPYEQNLDVRLSGPSREYPFGTDQFGRCVFSRILYGARISITIGIAAVLFGLIIGSGLGIIAGYRGGLTDLVLMRLMDVLMSIPALILALAVVAALGRSIPNMILAIGINALPLFARLSRSSVLSIRTMEYIEASEAIGTNSFNIIRYHVFKNCFSPLLIFSTLHTASAILMAAALSFLGLGVPPPTAEWGLMTAEARVYLRQAPYLVIFPSMVILVLVLGFNLIGDRLRDMLDPKLRF